MTVLLSVPTSHGNHLQELRSKCGKLRDEIFEACCALQREPDQVDLQRLMVIVRQLEMFEAECRDRENSAGIPR